MKKVIFVCLLFFGLTVGASAASPTPTDTPTVTATATGTATPTVTLTITPTVTPTRTPWNITFAYSECDSLFAIITDDAGDTHKGIMFNQVDFITINGFDYLKTYIRRFKCVPNGS